MYNQKIQSTFDYAEELYQAAQEEFSRPEEDVVSYRVCKNALGAIHQYLTGFALKNGIEVQAGTPLAALYDTCRIIDNRFYDLQLHALFNIIEEEYAWFDSKMTKVFIACAERTKNLAVTQEMDQNDLSINNV